MVTKRKSRKSVNCGLAVLGKPRGLILPRVQEVGPEHFGIVAVDCAKARSKWMFCDFYGKVLLPPTPVEHTRAGLQFAVLQLQEAIECHAIRDHIVAVEMTGTYHRPVQRAFREAGSETRLVHPFASQHYRVSSHGDIKTDDNDLAGIFRAAVNGFGLLEPAWDERYQQLQLICRYRRDLVEKRAKVQVQIRQYLERCLPGYAALFPDDELWTSSVALCVARRAGTAEAIRQAAIAGVTHWLREEKRQFHSVTVERLVSWSANAAQADPLARWQARVWHSLDDDRQSKSREITLLEREIAGLLVQTPYILLLSHPGIHVVSAGELAGEMGPIEHYAHARAITGRAGLFPSRYQSDEVDRADGPLSRFRNRRLRAAWLRVADNLIKCNAHFRGKNALWRSQKVDSRDARCRVANRATRTVFQMVSGRKLYFHPSRLDRLYVMDKLLTFHQEHRTPPHEILRDLQHAAAQIPPSAHAAEAKPLQAAYQRTQRSRRKQPLPLGTILVAVLAKLGVTELDCIPEAQDPEAS